jgi:Na+/melibiose symporter-like transporter
VQIGTSIFLIAVGAILRYAVTGSVEGVRIHVVGLILMVVGVIGLIAALIYAFFVDRPRRAAVVDRDYDTRRTRTYR